MARSSRRPCTYYEYLKFIVDKHQNINPLYNKLLKHTQSEGYSLPEISFVRTKDGYKLRLHRINSQTGLNLPKLKKKKPKFKGVVFMQHGLMCSSADWLVPGGLAYTLANSGYDVWMGNFRGNLYSYTHKELEQEDSEFWNFSWDEHGTIDLPTMIDHVLDVTNADQLTFIGHSMGTTAFFVMMNAYPEMNKKIKYAVALAPVTHVPNMHGIPRKTIYSISWAIWALKLVKLYNFFKYKKFMANAGIMCAIMYPAGYHSIDFDRTFRILGTAPAGTSIHNLSHYIQNFYKGKFHSRDGKTTYELSKVTCPITLWYTKADWAAGEKDTGLILSALGSEVKEVKEVILDNFGHLDFLWDLRAQNVLYNQIARDLDKIHCEITTNLKPILGTLGPNFDPFGPNLETIIKALLI